MTCLVTISPQVGSLQYEISEAFKGLCVLQNGKWTFCMCDPPPRPSSSLNFTVITTTRATVTHRALRSSEQERRERLCKTKFSIISFAGGIMCQ